jgi:hypothetical protein
VKTLSQFIAEEAASHPMIEVDGKMQHRHDSEGKPIHPTDEGIRNFHRWFVGSHAVDKHGRPQAFYHGTVHDITHFDGDKARGNEHYGTSKGTHYFSDSPHNASTYAGARTDMTGRVTHASGANVNKVYLRMAKPLKVNAKGNNWREVPFKGDHVTTDDIVDHAKSQGHDGAIIKNVVDTAGEHKKKQTTVAVYHPTQIKSATGNNGDFHIMSNHMGESTE